MTHGNIILIIFTDSKKPNAKGCGIPKVQSVKIPAAFHLYLFDDSKETRLSGPFSGPLEMADLGVEGNSSAFLKADLNLDWSTLSVENSSAKSDELVGK